MVTQYQKYLYCIILAYLTLDSLVFKHVFFLEELNALKESHLTEAEL